MRKRIESFQVLRGAAILLIFLSHCDHLLDIGGKNRLGYLGACGVSIFIALSGFLAAYKYSESDPPSRIKAYKAKWNKFGWLHTITLLAAIPLSFTLLRKNAIQWGATHVLNLALLQAWIPEQAVYFSFNAVSWYLSITLFFVIITPVVVKIWKCLDTKRTVAWSVVVLIFELSLCFFVQDKAYSHWIVYVFPITRALDFIIGGDCPKTFLTCEYLTGLRRQGGTFLLKLSRNFRIFKSSWTVSGGGIIGLQKACRVEEKLYPLGCCYVM